MAIVPEVIKNVLEAHIDEHMVKLKFVFISNSTEIGTVYTKKELEDISIFSETPTTEVVGFSLIFVKIMTYIYI